MLTFKVVVSNRKTTVLRINQNAELELIGPPDMNQDFAKNYIVKNERKNY